MISQRSGFLETRTLAKNEVFYFAAKSKDFKPDRSLEINEQNSFATFTFLTTLPITIEGVAIHQTLIVPIDDIRLAINEIVQIFSAIAGLELTNPDETLDSTLVVRTDIPFDANIVFC
jgi:hypothetical protein